MQVSEKAIFVVIERRLLEAVLRLHACDIPLTGDIVEPIRQAIAAADVTAGRNIENGICR